MNISSFERIKKFFEKYLVESIFILITLVLLLKIVGATTEKIDIDPYSKSFISAPIKDTATAKPTFLSEVGAEFTWAIFGGFIGSFIALYLDKYRKPKLIISASEEFNDDNNYDQNRTIPGRCKFFRVGVTNLQLSPAFKFLMARETAQEVYAKITFHEINKTMKGRWSGTLELPHASQDDWIRLATFPEPENILPGDTAILDVFFQPENDYLAYGWNNEAYLFRWRNHNYKLVPGKYTVDVIVYSLNGAFAKQQFIAEVNENIDDTRFYISPSS